MVTKKFSNVISPSKFIFWSVVSFGIYEVVWFYRNWKYIKEKEKLDISPFWRAWFAIFFINSLFKIALSYAKKEGYEKSFSPGWRTFWWIIFLLFSRADGSVFLLSALTFLPILAPLDAMNYYYCKKGPKNIRPLQWWHIMLAVFGIIWWILILLSFST